jgi:hypothetical protein
MARKRRTYTNSEWDGILRRRAEAMVQAGTMPPFEKVLQALQETRAKYIPLILAARKEKHVRE